MHDCTLSANLLDAAMLMVLLLRLQTFDCETGMDVELLDLNPGGWTGNANTWNMLYGMDVCSDLNLVLTGDTRGFLHLVDPRISAQLSTHLVHKKGNKVRSKAARCMP